MAEDLTQIIRQLSPGAMAIFKRQLASLPERERELAFSRLSGLPELADIVGPTPIEQPTLQEQRTLTTEEQPSLSQIMTSPQVPLWQKALAGFAAPFQWVHEKAIEPFAAAITSPFTPAVAGTEGMSWLQRELAEYRGWEEPTITMPWGAKFRPTKGIIETLPWLAIPGVGSFTVKGGTVVGRGIAGMLGRMGAAGRVAGTALEYSPWGLAEKAAGKVLETAAKPIAARFAARAAEKVTTDFDVGVRKVQEVLAKYPQRWASKKTLRGTVGSAQGLVRLPPEGRNELYNALTPLVGSSSARVMRDWRPTKIMLYLDNFPREAMSPEEIAGHFFGREVGTATFKPSQAWKQMTIPERVELAKSLGLEEKLGSKEWRYLSSADKKAISDRMLQGIESPSAVMAETAARGAEPPMVPPTTTAAVPGGLNPEQQGAIDRLVGSLKGYRSLARQTRLLRKPVRAERARTYESVLQELRAKGVPTTEARIRAKATLAGEYPKAPLSPEAEALVKELQKDQETLFNVIADTPINYGKGFGKEVAFTALEKVMLLESIAKHEIKVLEDVFGPKLSAELLKQRSLSARAWDFAVDLANLPRAFLASCDLSALLRQGAILFTRNPITGLKTVEPGLEAFFSNKNAALIDNIIRTRPGMEELLNPALRVTLDLTALPYKEAAILTQFEETFASRLVNKIPFVRGSNRAYVTMLNDLRSQSALNVMNQWKKAGIKYGADDLADLNQLINWSSGRGTLPKALQQQGRLLNSLFFAPKLQFSRIQFPTAILPMVTKSQLVRREAWRQLLQFVGAGAGILTAAKLSGVADVELDPRSADFGKLKVGDIRLDIWSGYTQYMRFAANMLTAQRKSVYGRVYQANRWDTLVRFLRTKESPFVGLINDMLVGETYLGEDLPPKSAKSVLGQMYERMMPLAIQDIVDGLQQEGPIGGVVSSIGMFGVGVVTYVDEVKREQDKAAQRSYGMTWDEVGTKLGRATQLRLSQETPAILKAEQEKEERFGAGTPTIMEQYQSEGQAIEDAFRQAIMLATQEFRKTGNGATFREKVSDAYNYRRRAYASRAIRKEYQDITAHYNQPLDPKKLPEMNPNDITRYEYYKLMFSPDMYDEFGNYRFNEAEKREQEFLVKYGQRALDYIEEYQGSRWLDRPIELKMLEEARELLKPYWQVANYVWSMYPPQLKALSDQIEIIERTNPEQAKTILRRYPQILRARELIARYRKMIRQANPAIQTAYRTFYSW